MTFSRNGSGRFGVSSTARDRRPSALRSGARKHGFTSWVERYVEDDSSWSQSHSRRPLTSAFRTPQEVEEIVKMVRLNLYNKDLFCGAQAIHWELEDLGVKPLALTANHQPHPQPE